MEAAHIFNNDFFVATMLDLMTPLQLHTYRFINNYTYNLITNDVITNKIIHLIQQKFRHIYGEKYDEFIEFLSKREIEIHGPFINSIIYEEETNTMINFRMIDDNMGESENDNVFTDYKAINPSVLYDAIDRYNFNRSWFHHESDYKNMLINDKLMLHIFSTSYEEISETFPKVFQNSIKVKNSKMTLKINYPILVMNKKQPITFSKEDDYYYDDQDIYKETKQLCQKYNIQCYFDTLNYYIFNNYKYPMIVYKKSDDQINITLCGQAFGSTNSSNIITNLTSTPMKYKCDGGDYQLGSRTNVKISINIEIQKAINVSECNDCPLSVFNFPHFHATINYSDDYFKDCLCNIVVLKYKDNNLFSKHKTILNSDTAIELDGKLVGKYFHNGCLEKVKTKRKSAITVAENW